MKIKDLRMKEIGELKKMLSDLKGDLPKVQMEQKISKDKNVKKASNIRRQVSIISGMITGKEQK